MNIYGLELAQSMLQAEGYFFKLVANDRAVYFFPYTTEHREAKQLALSYEDDSTGNALAATIRPGYIDFRFHQSFADRRVSMIAQRILDIPDLGFPPETIVTYQGRELKLREAD